MNSLVEMILLPWAVPLVVAEALSTPLVDEVGSVRLVLSQRLILGVALEGGPIVLGPDQSLDQNFERHL